MAKTIQLVAKVQAASSKHDLTSIDSAFFCSYATFSFFFQYSLFKQIPHALQIRFQRATCCRKCFSLLASEATQSVNSIYVIEFRSFSPTQQFLFYFILFFSFLGHTLNSLNFGVIIILGKCLSQAAEGVAWISIDVYRSSLKKLSSFFFDNYFLSIYIYI